MYYHNDLKNINSLKQTTLNEKLTAKYWKYCMVKSYMYSVLLHYMEASFMN